MKKPEATSQLTDEAVRRIAAYLTDRFKLSEVSNESLRELVRVTVQLALFEMDAT